MSAGSNADEQSPLLVDYVMTNADEASSVIGDDGQTITVRRPVQFPSINSRESDQVVTGAARATIDRYKYYGKLDPRRESTLRMPNHIVPAAYFMFLPIKPEVGNQSSIITIFSIWNTMVGTSILSMPWALERAGFACGISIMILMAGLCLYTSYIVMRSPSMAGVSGVAAVDFSDICRHYLGRFGEYTSIAFSLVVLLGATIVYWVLMTNFLYNVVLFIYEKANNELNSTSPTTLIPFPEVVCPNPPAFNINTSTIGVNPYHSPDASRLSPMDTGLGNHSDPAVEPFYRVWTMQRSAPLFLVLILLPLVNFKSPTFFTKFNALGTLSVIYILTFVAVKGGTWGVHIDFNPGTQFYIPEFQWSFPALTGTLSLAMFIHNCVLSIVRNQKHPENNGRDLSIAYVCVVVTYIFVGVTFYSCFPLPKLCIEANLLDNLHNFDLMSFAARVFLLFQMITVFPLLMYIGRIQLLNTLFGSTYPSLVHVVVMNLCVMAVCVIFAMFLPHIGTIIRFTGAFSAMAYVFALPCTVVMLARYRQGTLTWPLAAAHVLIIALGILNFISQFLILGLD